LNFGKEWISEERYLINIPADWIPEWLMSSPKPYTLSYHEAWGLLTYMIGLGLFAGVAWWLGRALPERAVEGAPQESSKEPTEGAAPVVLTGSLPYRLGGVAVCLAAAALAQWGLSAHLRAGERLAAAPEL